MVVLLWSGQESGVRSQDRNSQVRNKLMKLPLQKNAESRVTTSKVTRDRYQLVTARQAARTARAAMLSLPQKAVLNPSHSSQLLTIPCNAEIKLMIALFSRRLTKRGTSLLTSYRLRGTELRTHIIPTTNDNAEQRNSRRSA